MYITFPKFDALGVKHAFTTRKGGVSEGMYSSFNTGFASGDKKEAVYENFRRLCSQIGVDERRLIFARQTHTANVRVVSGEDIGKGIVKPLDYNDVDGLISNLPGVGLVTQYADCVPLMFFDPVRRVIATSHAGWRGTVKEIGRVTVESMVRQFGCEPADIVAGIGPCIGHCCYEVDSPVFDAFSAIDYINPYDIFTPADEGKYMLDLKAANKFILMTAGIREENIDISDLCTCCCHEYLHSHRYTGGKRGNLGLVIAL